LVNHHAINTSADDCHHQFCAAASVCVVYMLLALSLLSLSCTHRYTIFKLLSMQNYVFRPDTFIIRFLYIVHKFLVNWIYRWANRCKRTALLNNHLRGNKVE
jgi:hypothetical protein